MRGIYLLVLITVFATASVANLAPEQLIRHQADTLLQRSAAAQPEAPSPDQLETLVSEVVAPHVDFTLFSCLVLGKYWRSLSAQQQQRFEKDLTHLAIQIYSHALASASGLRISYLGAKKDTRDERAVVPTIVRSAGNPPVRIDYKLYAKQGEWKVYDVAIEGVSMAINYRNVLTERIRASGMRAVLDSLSDEAAPPAAK